MSVISMSFGKPHFKIELLMQKKTAIDEVLFPSPAHLNLHFRSKQRGQTLTLSLRVTAGVLVFQHGIESGLLP